jgi:hypothetical protein
VQVMGTSGFAQGKPRDDKLVVRWCILELGCLESQKLKGGWCVRYGVREESGMEKRTGRYRREDFFVLVS